MFLLWEESQFLWVFRITPANYSYHEISTFVQSLWLPYRRNLIQIYKFRCTHDVRMLKNEDCVKSNVIFGLIRCIGAVALCMYMLAKTPHPALKSTIFIESPPSSVSTYYVNSSSTRVALESVTKRTDWNEVSEVNSAYYVSILHSDIQCDCQLLHFKY